MAFSRSLFKNNFSGATGCSLLVLEKLFPSFLKYEWQAKKQGKTSLFFVLSWRDAFLTISLPYGNLSFSYPFLYAIVSVIPAFLVCSYVFLLFGGCVSLFLSMTHEDRNPNTERIDEKNLQDVII